MLFGLRFGKYIERRLSLGSVEKLEIGFTTGKLIPGPGKPKLKLLAILTISSILLVVFWFTMAELEAQILSRLSGLQY